MRSIGIMQGRLTPRGPKPIQFFPFDNWQNEFKDAVEIGINEIEFIFDFDRFEENPLWSDPGISEINNLVKKTGVKVNTICADYFMARPFFRTDEKTRQKNVQVLKQLLKTANRIGAKGIEIPLVDNSSIKTGDEEKLLLDSISECLETAKSQNVWIGLETDLPPERFLSLLQSFNSPFIRANYDTGNSSGLGYKHNEGLAAYGRSIANIHIKDRILGGTTVPLGSGNADFDEFFRALRKVDYKGSFILQVARGEDGKERETVSKQKAFVESYISKYLT